MAQEKIDSNLMHQPNQSTVSSEDAIPFAILGLFLLIGYFILRKAFGMANWELKVQMKPENVLQLASITKQFTSVAILILMEQGKLSLHDPLSKYIVDFPRGNEIPLQHLLNHTSGIRDYSRIPELRDKTPLDMTPEALISTFKNLSPWNLMQTRSMIIAIQAIFF